jgi:hypothetical protein
MDGRSYSAAIAHERANYQCLAATIATIEVRSHV